MEIFGNLVLIEEKKIRGGKLIIVNNKIKDIVFDDKTYDQYILPGLIDSHVHIESSMLLPENFGDIALKNGTVAVVTDPHEIANVLGTKGIEFMMNNAKNTPLKIFFGIPSCVPATSFETSGAIISSNEIEPLLKKENVVALSEMMNFPGVIFDDPEVLKKLSIAKNLNLSIDGHAPGLTGDNLTKYVNAGISTDHECSTLDEALEKIKLGMKIQIREGSAARNFEALFSLIDSNPDDVLLCTDDSHPDELIDKGHINKIIKLGINKDLDAFNLLKAASVNPVKHYNLPVGQLRKGDPADFIIVDNLIDFNILDTYINGNKVVASIRSQANSSINLFKTNPISASSFALKIDKPVVKINVISARDGDLLTGSEIASITTENGFINSDESKDILKLVVLNRYTENAIPAIGFIKGFGINSGAIASTVAHDSHNIIAVGTNDELIATAINKIIETKGGIVAVDNKNNFEHLALPVAGLLSTEPVEIVAEKYKKLNQFVYNLGSNLRAPFMTLSFMALLVIPELKLSDKGLFDGVNFKFKNLIEE